MITVCIIVMICVGMLYASTKALSSWLHPKSNVQRAHTPIKPLSPQDFTLDKLSKYDGIQHPNILIAINGSVFDVTNAAYDLYGPNARYAKCAGKDASRALAKFSVDESMFRKGFDTLDDLTEEDYRNLREHYEQFKENYDYVGQLLRIKKHCSIDDVSDVEEEEEEEIPRSRQRGRGSCEKRRAESLSEKHKQSYDQGGKEEEEENEKQQNDHEDKKASQSNDARRHSAAKSHPPSASSSTGNLVAAAAANENAIWVSYQQKNMLTQISSEKSLE